MTKDEPSEFNIWADPNVKNMAGIMMFEFIHDYIVYERKNALEAFLNSREGNTKKATLLKTQHDRREAVRLA